MQDRPTDRELIEAVAQFVSEELLPLTAENPRLRFRSLIAINVLGIVARELTESEPLMRAEWQRLVTLFEQPDLEVPGSSGELRAAIESFNREICRQLRHDTQPESEEWQTKLVEHLQTTVREKLQIANPRFLEREMSK